MFPTDHEFRRYAIAQATAKRIATRIAQQIEPGMTEADAYNLAEQSFQREGIRRHWHMPVIGLGEGTLKLRSIGALAHARITRGRRYAALGDAVMIDIAPVVDGYPSDYTWSGALGTPSETALAAAAHKFTQSVVGQLAHTDVGSDIWRLAERLGSIDAGVRWVPVPVIGLGHRLIRIPATWLHWSGARYLYLALTRGPAFLSGPRAVSLRDFWMIEPYLSDGHRAAKYEQMVFMGGDARLMVDLDSGEPTWRDIPQTHIDGLR